MSPSPRTRTDEKGRPLDPNIDQIRGRAVVPYHAHCPECSTRYLIRYWAPSTDTQGPWQELAQNEDEDDLTHPCPEDACQALIDLTDPDTWHLSTPPSP